MTVTVSITDLETRLVTFLGQYFDLEAARRSAEVILWSEKRGIAAQGLLKLTGTEPLQGVKPTGPFGLTDKSPVSVLITANRQPSFYAAQVATDLAIEKAAQSGFAVIGVNGLFSSTGALGFYAERMARAGLIGIAMARSPGAIAPFGTHTPLFGTNPLAAGFPTMGEPLVFDMATSAITWYELVLAKMKGYSIPADVAIDRDGQPTTDPAAAMAGGLHPFDRGHKGSGLAMLVEIMSGPLVGAAFCDHKTFDQDWGFFLLAFKPDLLVDLDSFKKNCSELIDTVRAAALPGEPVRLPGDRATQHLQKVEAAGHLDVDDEIVALLGL